MISLLQSALQYLASGKSVFPVVITSDGKKRPLVKWKKFQTRLPTPEEVCSWWTRWPQAAIGMVTGSISGCCALDIDPRNGGNLKGKPLPAGPRSQTMHGGKHHFFRFPPTHLRTKCSILPGVDFKGEGGFVVLPPTPSYTWIQQTGEWPELPSWVIKSHRHPKQEKRVIQVRQQLPYTDVVRCLPSLNAEGWGRRLHWPLIVWYLLRVLDQQRGGNSWIPYDQVLKYLLSQGFYLAEVEKILRSGDGIFWDLQRRNIIPVLHLHGIERVCSTLRVDIRSAYDREMRRLPEWQTVPLQDFTEDKRLACFRSVACYEPANSKGRKISRPAIADRSSVSPSTQVRDADKLGLLKKRGRRRVQGVPTYTPNLEEHGPRTLQEDSILKGMASRGPVGLLGWVSRRMEREGKSFNKPVGSSVTPEPVQASSPAIHPWRWFDSDRQYNQASDKTTKGSLAPLIVDSNAEVPMTPTEVASLLLRRNVSLWRRPTRVMEDLRGGVYTQL